MESFTTATNQENEAPAQSQEPSEQQQTEYVPVHEDEGPDVIERPSDTPEPAEPAPTPGPAPEPAEPQPAPAEPQIEQNQQPAENAKTETSDQGTDYVPVHEDEGPDVIEQPTTTTSPEVPVISDQPDIVHNQNLSPESEHTTVIEVLDTRNDLPETGSELTGLGIIGGAALALGAGAIALKHRREQRNR